jgi:hypothetical protein
VLRPAGGVPIPASNAKGEPSHQHVDFRYLLQLTSGADVARQAEEVDGYAWRDADTLADERLPERVRAGLRGLG